MHKMAAALSEMGRFGDTQLVHVNAAEIELLNKVGSGTVNPHTGLREYFFGYTSIGDMFDGGGPGKSGDTYGNDAAQSAAADKDNDGHISAAEAAAAGGLKGGWDGDSDKGSFFSDYSDIGDMFDGGGPQHSGDTYGNSLSASLAADTNRDGRISAQEAAAVGGLKGGWDGDTDKGSFFSDNIDTPMEKALNAIAFVSNPVGYAVVRGVQSLATNMLDRNADGQVTWGDFKSSGNTSSGAQSNVLSGGGDDERGDQDQPTTITETTDGISTTGGSTDDTGAANEDGTYSSVAGNFAYNSFSSSRPGREYLEYGYVDEYGRPSGTYNRNTKPFHISLSQQDANSYAFSEQTSAAIEQMISELPADMQRQLNGNLTAHLTPDGTIALVAGNKDTGYVEATYEASDEGYQNVLNDIRAMTAYMGETGDATVDGGFVGRMTSYANYHAYTTPDLYGLLATIQAEIAMYAEGTPQHSGAAGEIAALQREISRRTQSGDQSSVSYSVAGVTSSIAKNANAIISGAA